MHDDDSRGNILLNMHKFSLDGWYPMETIRPVISDITGLLSPKRPQHAGSPSLPVPPIGNVRSEKGCHMLKYYL